MQQIGLPGMPVNHMQAQGGDDAQASGEQRKPKTDWRYLFRKVDAELKTKHKGAILTHLEVTHWSHMLKEEAITEENMHADGTIDKLITKAFKTLEVLMGALML